MAFSVSEQLQKVYSDDYSKYNREKEAEEEQLSSIEFVYSLIRLGTAVAYFKYSMHVAMIVSQN